MLILFSLSKQHMQKSHMSSLQKEENRIISRGLCFVQDLDSLVSAGEHRPSQWGEHLEHSSYAVGKEAVFLPYH